MDSISVLVLLLLLFGIKEANALICMEESTNEKNPVIWPLAFASSNKIVSSPLCLNENQELITRTCTSSGWHPSHSDMIDCNITQSKAPVEECPPYYNSVLDRNGRIKFCYQLTQPDSWKYPCFNSGSTLTLFDLEVEDLRALADKLTFEGNKLVWFPAARAVNYGPLIYTLPGKKWGKEIDLEHITIYTRLPVTQNCLLYDLDKRTVKTENCSYKYPNLCISNTKHLLKLHCPGGYRTTKYSDDQRCFGIERVDEEMTWKQFKSDICPEPLHINNQLEQVLLQELVEEEDLDDDIEDGCFMGLVKKASKYLWYPDKLASFVNWNTQMNFSHIEEDKYGIIQETYSWDLVPLAEELKCMACQKRPEFVLPEIGLQASSDQENLILTIYSPNALWKKESDDVGVNCFTNAEGFVKKIDLKKDIWRKIRYPLRIFGLNITSQPPSFVEKSTLTVERVNNLIGEYWCEGHSSYNFTKITSNVILLSSKSSDDHAYSLRLKVKNVCMDLSLCCPDWETIAEIVKNSVKAEDARIMSVLSIDANSTAEIIFHVNIKLFTDDDCMNTCAITKTYKWLKQRAESVFKPSSNITFVRLKSTVYCMPVENDDEFSLHWEITMINGTTAPQELCMQENGLPVTRKCSGSFLMGGSWDNIVGYCSGNFEATNKTKYLHEIAKGNSDIDTISEFANHGLMDILDDKNDLIPADIYFMSVSLKVVVDTANTNSTVVDLGDTGRIAITVDSLMNLDKDYLNLAQTMNSTNSILESLDKIFSKIAWNESGISMNDDYGVDRAVTSQFVIQISDPSINNVTGIALLRRPGQSVENFTNFDIIPLYSNSSIPEVIAIENLECATWVTDEILNYLNNSTIGATFPLKIIIGIYYNDIIFQETKPDKDMVNGRVVSVIIPGFDTNLMAPLPLVYRSNETDKKCAYWDFNAPSEYSSGEWRHTGCYHITNSGDLDVCGCFHLTHFAQLVLGSKGNSSGANHSMNNHHGLALNAITVVGCTLSLFGIFGIFTTALVFRSWRQKPGSKVLLQLSLAICMQYINMLLQNSIEKEVICCVIFGALLHYAVLASFMWMLLTALLQFARYVRVLGAQRPARFIMKFSIIGWCIPILPVSILLAVNYDSYIPLSAVSLLYDNVVYRVDPNGGLCYPKDMGLYLTVLMPIAAIILTNCIVFFLVLKSILSISHEGKNKPFDPQLIASQLRVSALLFFLLGLSWIFGLLATTSRQIIFSYLFCLTATMQGFVLFVYFVVCDPSTRVLWVSLVRKGSKNAVSREASTNLSRVK